MTDDANPNHLSFSDYQRRAKREHQLFVAGCLRATSRGVKKAYRSLVRSCLWLISEYLIWRGMRALQQLDDQLLADVGVPRSEIERAVRHGRLSRRNGSTYQQRMRPHMQLARNPGVRSAG